LDTVLPRTDLGLSKTQPAICSVTFIIIIIIIIIIHLSQLIYSVAGFGITIHFLTEFGGVLDLLLMVPPRYNNNTVGLLGVMNNNPSDDLTTPDGRIIPISSVDKQIFNDFGQECTSLF